MPATPIPYPAGPLAACPRCGADHARLDCYLFTRPPHDRPDVAGWAPCPATGEPILLSRAGLVAAGVLPPSPE